MHSRTHHTRAGLLAEPLLSHSSPAQKKNTFPFLQLFQKYVAAEPKALLSIVSDLTWLLNFTDSWEFPTRLQDLPLLTRATYRE